MIDYCTKATCLRESILRYFGQRSAGACGACSRCVSGHYPQVNGMKRPTKKELEATGRVLPRAGQSLAANVAAADDSLLEALRAVRTQLSHELNVPAYWVFDNKTLTDMAMKRPRTEEQLLRVNGIGRVKLERFGRRFLDCINDWLREHGESSGSSTAAGTGTRAARVAEKLCSPTGWTQTEI